MRSAAVRVAIDLSFGALMSPKEHASVSNQIKRAYSLNKKAAHPVALHLTALASLTAHPAMLGSCVGHRSWEGVVSVDAPADEHFAREAVWLTPDAPEPLETLSAEDVYIIGGLVDRSVKKGVTLRRAHAAGVRSLRLPMKEHAPRPDLHPILSINAVVALLADVHSGQTWEEALAAHLPARYAKRRVREERHRQA